MNLFEKTGKMALGSRLRLFTARITEDAAKIYELYDVDLVPKWFPVFFVLSEDGENTVTEIASQIGHSQPSVSKIVKEMTAGGLVKENMKSSDKRRTVVALTKKGRAISERLRIQCLDVDAVIDSIISEARSNLWEALEEWEYLLDQKSLLNRVQEQRKQREGREIEIVEYHEKYQEAFKALNEEWISKYFVIEDTDRKALDNPKSYILDNGGRIFVALYKGQPVGVCSLIKMNDPDYDYELAKMAVSPAMQGKNIGWLLGQTALAAARELGASKLYLESNTLLKPAINLYHKLGFKKVFGRATPYARANIQMELSLGED
ncbi:bifunctional helix-turn-helix transcriptional regulator/GNAT family N-acetyltransferase [Pararcticibacter amylolyticus]|uniref:MarR family transcriptional regulator n=1 Tax=Pararcticibacter amylolyticus TaxID=2173175 RepID=A0A2U2PBP0_9SPHI|nr:helix-turn-helix domain-containing GNAT family N-acetyltransferase [Pararcticibacter amylolyticus]PWG78539.1 MarR family transcriptional regulator [Pararcticibacter amylolyticus]